MAPFGVNTRRSISDSRKKLAAPTDDLVNVGSNGNAFGVADNTTMTIMDPLLATDAQSVDGVLYGGNVTKRTEANNAYTAINQAVKIN